MWTRRKFGTWAASFPLAASPLIQSCTMQKAEQPVSPTSADETTEPQPLKPWPRMALEKFVQNEDRRRALINGVRRMKDIALVPPSNPGSWFFQGAVHAVQERDSQDRPDYPWTIEFMQRRDPKISQINQAVLWNRCPHGLKGRTDVAADFLIWHRAYLYHFERLLRAASGEPKFSLPYWNYTEDAQNRMPEIFRVEKDPFQPELDNPLYNAPRRNGVNRGARFPSDVRSAQTAMGEETFFGWSAESKNGFGGGTRSFQSSSGPASPMGRIEATPHNDMHGAIGGWFGDMGNPLTAGFDPIFWMHHCNIDRLWADWETDPKREWGDRPSDAWLREAPWSFYDADGSIKKMSRTFYLHRMNLGVEYDSDDNTKTPLSVREPLVVSADETEGPALIVDRAPVATTLVGTGARVEIDASAATDSLVRRTQSADESGGLPPAIGTHGEAILLELAGVKVTEDTNVGYDVYLDADIGDELNRNDPRYIGPINFFSLRHGGDYGSAHAQLFYITNLVNERRLNASDIRIVFKPYLVLEALGSADETGGPPPTLRGSLSIDAVNILQAAN